MAFLTDVESISVLVYAVDWLVVCSQGWTIFCFWICCWFSCCYSLMLPLHHMLYCVDARQNQSLSLYMLLIFIHCIQWWINFSMYTWCRLFCVCVQGRIKFCACICCWLISLCSQGWINFCVCRRCRLICVCSQARTNFWACVYI